MNEKKRDFLKITGISEDDKKKLKEHALREFGKPNISLFLRSFIGKTITKTATSENNPTDERARVQTTVSKKLYEEIKQKAELGLLKPAQYLANLMYADTGRPQLSGGELEALRRSNYELAKIGTNLNQLAKAFNTLVKLQDTKNTPELGKKLAALRNEITAHTNKVLKVIERGSITLAAQTKKGSEKGQKRAKTNRG